MYGLLTLTCHEYEGVQNGELRCVEVATGKTMIFSPKGMILFLGEGVRGANNERWIFRI